MCQFFSLISDWKGKIYYFDWPLREKCLKKELDYNPDSHTSIADYFGFKGKKEDSVNKYEYNPLTKVFKVDQLNTTDDSKDVENQCNKLDFSLIVPRLVIKPIIQPLQDFPIVKKVTKKDIELLRQWASVLDSVGASVRASVRASVWAYIGSFFLLEEWKYIKHKKGEYPYQPAVDLWEKGLVPSFDGKTWRIHSGKNATVVYEISQEGL